MGDHPILRGPTDPDHFRVAVGRYGDRWYHDPLPADDLHPTTTAAWPSVSTCKKASGSDWSFVALKRVNAALDERPNRFDGMNADERYEALKAINKLGLSSAASRGTNVHLMAEARLYGRTALIGNTSPGVEYRAAVDSFFDTYQPELVAAEFVCIHRDLNGFGYGGTCDAALRIDGKTYIVDWKSRGDDSQHGAYPEEAAQIAAYARSQYIIAEGANGAERRPVPAFDGGLIVSIKPDGCRVYPIDLEAAFDHWASLHAWWVARREERAAIGRTWAANKPAALPGFDADQPKFAAVASSTTAAPAGEAVGTPVAPASPPETSAMPDFDAPPTVAPSELVPAPPAPAAELDMDAILLEAEASVAADRFGGGGMAMAPATLSPADQQNIVRARAFAGEGDDADFGALQAAHEAVSANGRAWIKALALQGMQAGVSFHASQARTVRRHELMRGLVHLAAADAADDEVLRALLEHVIGDVAHFAAVPPGQLLGSLDVHEATRFAQQVDTFIAGELVASISDTGTFSLSPAA